MSVTAYANRAAWEAARNSAPGVGCSDLAALLGVSRFRSPWDIFGEKVLRLPRKVSDSQAADYRRGHALEGYILDEYAARTGYTLTRGFLSVSNAAIPWLRGSPDALVEATEDGDGGADGKTSRDAWEWAEDGKEIEAWVEGSEQSLPVDMALQGFGYMALTDRGWWDFCVMLPWFEIRHIRLHRDLSVERSLLERGAELVDRYLVRQQAPGIDASDACKRALQAQWDARRAAAIAEKTPREATPAQAEALLAYGVAYQAEAAAKKAKELAGNRLRAAIEDAPAVRHAHLTISNGAQFRLNIRSTT